MKATKDQRAKCKQDYTRVSQVLAAGVECDDCDTPAVAGSANDQDAHFHCAMHYMLHITLERAARPSGVELARRVNAAIAGAQA